MVEHPVGQKLIVICGLLVPLFASVVASTRQLDLRQDTFESNGVRIHYLEQGQGTPVVLIHGYIGTSERHWVRTGVFADLARDHRVIALDCRGHGKSDKPVEPHAYGAEMGQDIVRLLDHLKLPRAHIVGFSMGAIIAGHLLTTNPDRFITATFVGYHAVRTWTAEDDREAEASARDLEGDTPFRLLILGISRPDSPPRDEEIRKLSQQLAAVNDTKALAAYHRGRRGLVVADNQMAAVRVPTLGVIGTADPSIAGLRDLERVMPAMKVVVIDGAEHGGERGILRRPELLSTVRNFFSTSR
jgi:pimeloyl-ACP methyl ester carboxylesterase